MPLLDGLRRIFQRGARTAETRSPGRVAQGVRARTCHVIVLDGTLSSLREGRETHAGITFKLIREAVAGAGASAAVTAWYSAGIQWPTWRSTWDVLTGRGIERQIARAYGVLASRFRPGDRIVLVGFSRGGFAIRSLAGMIGSVGLLRMDAANVRNIRQAFRHYRAGASSEAAAAFRAHHCHESVQIEALAAWDCVKALGTGLPGLRSAAGDPQAYHRVGLAPHIRNAWHALALDETREAFHPVLFPEDPAWQGHLEQMWFRGTHGDIGGQLDGFDAARPLANIPLLWMLEKLAHHGVPLPEGYEARFPTDPAAPSLGTWQGWSKLLLHRRRRVALTGPSEHLHPTAHAVPAPPGRRARAPAGLVAPPGE
ncbi:DUF2235 domain-containing protein [Pseudoroseicyclus sp. CXY001]|uniref:DUF2235 domain-containing protein n=1 Tax=Pseudoroseicyclus sp. CXY001 TaxID=3242492 RepID=UPI0035713B4B